MSQSQSPNRAGRAGEPEEHLSRIPTDRNLFRIASLGSTEARASLVLIYRVAIRRFLGALLRDDDRADEAAQRFLTRMMAGGFDDKPPAVAEGRFRFYLKQAARRVALDLLEEERRRERSGQGLNREFDAVDPSSLPERVWDEECRRLMLYGALDALGDYQRSHDQNVSSTALALLAAHPEETSKELADRMSEIVGHPVEAPAYRKQIERARRLLAGFLVDLIAQTLREPTPEGVEDEMRELGLMHFVGDFLPPDWRSRGELVDLDQVPGLPD